MSLTTIKPMLELVPEAYEHVKTAHVNEPYGTANRETTMLSALAIEYAKLPGVDAQQIGIEKIAQVEKAIDLYGVRDQLQPFFDLMHDRYPTGGLTKQAAAELTIAEQILESDFAGIVDLEKTASRCQELYDAFGDSVKSEKVLRHAGVGFLNKEAALVNLMGRYQRTKNEAFTKIATVIRGTDPTKLTREDLCSLGNAITALDKEAHLMGMDFFDECLLSKTAEIAAALKVNLGNKTVSVDRIIAAAPDLVDALGADVVKSLTGDPQTVKAVAESLPNDLKAILARYV